jgi:hypothetical protein
MEEPFSKRTRNMNNTIMIHDNNRNTVQTGKTMFERPYHSNPGNMSHQQDVFEVLKYHTKEMVYSLITEMGCTLIHYSVQ